MARIQQFILLASILSTSCCFAFQNDIRFIDENETPFGPLLPERSELFRFSRATKGGLFAKYEQRQLEKQQLQEQQQQQQLQQQNQQQVKTEESPQVEVRDRELVAAEMPKFNSVQTSSTSSSGDSTSSQQEVKNNNDNSDFSFSPPLPPTLPLPSSSSSPPSTSSSNSGSDSKSSHSKTYTTITTTTTQQLNQEPQRVSNLREVRVHTVPLSQAVHYANYVVVPSSNAASAAAARLEESSSSSSSSSHKSSSSKTSESESAVAVPVQAPPATTVILPPVVQQQNEEVGQVLSRLIVERPTSSFVVHQSPSSVSVSKSSSSSHSSRVIERDSVAPPVYMVKRVIEPAVYAAKLVEVPAPNPVSSDDGHLKEEHFHSESKSSREESHGLGHLSSSTSSSSSSSSSSSRSSKSSTATSQTAALIAPPLPPPTPVVHHRVTYYQPPAPLVAIKSAPLVASRGANSYSVDVDHHYSGPNVKYGYSIKQQSSEPETKGLLVGERVVYL